MKNQSISIIARVLAGLLFILSPAQAAQAETLRLLTWGSYVPEVLIKKGADIDNYCKCFFTHCFNRII